ncbi:DUF3796 domain-containing protein [Sporosarcina sp. ACRSL]|uniref:DUF3796 domain-containing protein n=1 Tax=Sporosarcina sp. ACRSL TaxID=2918215 RepID=UPI001EF43BDB|nr:DUF3796 domain-containing protein [Sporosarcina sp. ACRSL]MCG7345587.1 DUF3796 domain-containing protein [Sporosarcina sp. ACRSL]
MDLSVEGLAGFITGAGLVLFIAFLYFRKGRKERRFDERYQEIHTKARTLSWTLTLIVLLIMWLGSLIVEGPKLAFILLASAYGVMLVSYGIAVLFLNKRL